ncbi:MAG: hypothetical protein PHF63_09505 [Herbinix sp.]|nr:hypothetical protein [Herbinix sp.]
MPWCPNCKAEYQEGYTECTDCKVALVEKLEEAEIFEPFFQAEDKKVAEKLVKFFEYSDLKCELHYDDKNQLYVVAIPPKQEKQAKKLYQAFYYVEASRAVSNSKKDITKEDGDSSIVNEEDSSSSDETEEYQNPVFDDDSLTDEEKHEDEVPSDDESAYESHEETVYVMKADQYKDLTSSVWIFLIFGVVGVIFVLLNVTEIFHVFNGWIPNTVMGALFLLFIYIALSTNKKAKKVQSEIEAENKLTEDINEWMKLNVTDNFLTSLHDDTISDELNYIKTTDMIKENLIKEFGHQNLAYLDRLIDEYYNSTFDNEK